MKHNNINTDDLVCNAGTHSMIGIVSMQLTMMRTKGKTRDMNKIVYPMWLMQN